MSVKLGGGAAAPTYLVDPATGAPYAATGGGGGSGDASAANQTTQINQITALSKAEDAAHASGDTGLMLLAVRKDAAAALAGTDGDYIPLIVDALGRLWVAAQGNVNSGAADSGAPVKVGGVYNSTAPALTNGQRGDIQLAPDGSQRISPANSAVLAGSIAALNGDLVASMDASAYRSGTIHLSGTFVATVQVQFSVDGTNWIAGRIYNVNTNIPASNATTVGMYVFAVPPGAQIRIRVTAYTSGTVVASAGLSSLPFTPTDQSIAIANWGAVGVANASANFSSTDTTSPNTATPLVTAVQELFDGTNLVRGRADAGKFAQVATAATLTKVATPTVSTTPAYTSGDSIGGLISLTSAVRYAAGGGTITSVVISDKAKQSAPIDVIFFTANPGSTTFTDNGALAVNAADLISIVGVISVTSYSAFSANSVGSALGQSLPFVLGSGTTLYAALVARGTPTYASTSDVQLTVGILPD